VRLAQAQAGAPDLSLQLNGWQPQVSLANSSSAAHRLRRVRHPAPGAARAAENRHTISGATVDYVANQAV
jgi:hypothetical protein